MDISRPYHLKLYRDFWNTSERKLYHLFEISSTHQGFYFWGRAGGWSWVGGLKKQHQISLDISSSYHLKNYIGTSETRVKRKLYHSTHQGFGIWGRGGGWSGLKKATSDFVGYMNMYTSLKLYWNFWNTSQKRKLYHSTHQGFVIWEWAGGWSGGRSWVGGLKKQHQIYEHEHASKIRKLYWNTSQKKENYSILLTKGSTSEGGLVGGLVGGAGWAVWKSNIRYMYMNTSLR